MKTVALVFVLPVLLILTIVSVYIYFLNGNNLPKPEAD